MKKREMNNVKQTNGGFKMIDTALENRVKEKRTKFIDSLKELNLKAEAIDNIISLADNMEYANTQGEKELARQYKQQIKSYILKSKQ